MLSEEHNLGMKEWQRQSDIFDEIAPWPWWLRVLAWREHGDYTAKGLRRRVRKATQRARRGWSDEDNWNAHIYLAHIIVEITRKLGHLGNGYPSELTPDSWADILERIAVGFEAAISLANLEYEVGDDLERARLEAVFAEGAQLFGDHFQSLWD